MSPKLKFLNRRETPKREEKWLIQGRTTEISQRPLKGVPVRYWEGRNIGPFGTLASWRFKVYFASG
jgi:hypothetical protein